MTLRRMTPLKASRGTEWPRDVRAAAYALMPRCIGPLVGMPLLCAGGLELDHVRASGALSAKSRSTLDNAARLCVQHHREKESHAREWRPKLVAFVADLLERAGLSHASHVDPCGDPACPAAVA